MLSFQLHSTPDVQTVWILFNKHCRMYSVNKSLANISKRLVMAGSDVKVKSFDSIVPSPNEAWRNQNNGPMRNLSVDEDIMKYSFLGIRKRCNYSINLHLASELEFFFIYFSAHAVQFSPISVYKLKQGRCFLTIPSLIGKEGVLFFMHMLHCFSLITSQERAAGQTST